MALLDTITVRLQADVGQFQNGMAQAAGTVNTFTATSANAQRGIVRMRNALASVAAQSLAANSAVGQFALGLGSLAGLGAIELAAILAPLAGIAIGFKRAKDEAKRFFDELQVERNRRQRELTAIGNANLSPAEFRSLLADAQQKFAESLRDMSTIVGIFGPAIYDATKLADAIAGKLGPAAQAAAQDVAALQAAIDRVSRSEREALQEFTQTQQLFLEGINRDVAQIGPPDLKPFVLDLRETMDTAGKIIGKDLAQGIDEGFRKESDRLVADIKRELSKTKNVTEDIRKTMRRMGEDAIRSFVEGFVDGRNNFLDTIFNFIKGLLIESVTNAISKRIFGGHGSNPGGVGPGGNIPEVAPSLVGGPAASFAFAMDVSGLPAPLTPFDAARDQLWQRVLRESVLVASDQGFRGRR